MFRLKHLYSAMVTLALRHAALQGQIKRPMNGDWQAPILLLLKPHWLTILLSIARLQVSSCHLFQT
jgi:hypothetical protein